MEIDAPLADSHSAKTWQPLPPPGFSSWSRSQQGPSLEFLWPENLPTGRSIFVASSRLGRKLDNYDSLFDALRTLAARLNPAHDFLITAAGTTMDLYLRRLATLFGLKCVVFAFEFENSSASDSHLTRAQGPTSETFFTCLIRPNKSRQELDVATLNSSPPAETAAFNLDRLLIHLANEVRCLAVRANGNVDRAITERLQLAATHRVDNSDPFQLDATHLLIDRRLTTLKTQTRLLKNGAVAWWLYRSEPAQRCPTGELSKPEPEPHPVPGNLTQRHPHVPILEIDEIQVEQFLLHWTRRRVGPWPDQTQDEYLDDLIFQHHRRQHDETATLGRILASERILATNQLTRDLQPVVCFTEILLTELQQYRVYRSHLGRWDCEPFGIAVDRQVLIDRGAREVIYGDENTWQQLAPLDRPFFQTRYSNHQQIDWSREKEWRLPSDLNLRELPLHSVLVFVANLQSAHEIGLISRWPIVVLAGHASEQH